MALRFSKKNKASAVSAAGGLAMMVCSYLLLAAVNAFLGRKDG